MTVFFLLILLATAGTLFSRRRWGPALAFAALAAMSVWGSNAFSVWFSGGLERRYAGGLPAGDAEAIVVLGGAIYPPDPTQPEILPAYGTYLRCHHAALLYRTWKRLPVVATAGPVMSRGVAVDATVAMRRVLEAEGVPADAIEVENESMTTGDNARNTAAILRGKGIRRIALVTEAFHMPRAQRMFERQGLTVEPAPCAFKWGPFEGTWREYVFPRAESVIANQQVLHEWAGLIWYRVKGT